MPNDFKYLVGVEEMTRAVASLRNTVDDFGRYVGYFAEHVNRLERLQEDQRVLMNSKEWENIVSHPSEGGQS